MANGTGSGFPHSPRRVSSAVGISLLWSLASLGGPLAFALATSGCSSNSAAASLAPGEANQDGDEGDIQASREAITDIEQTDVKRQSIGNCWIYATTSWLESLNKSATGTSTNASESYLSYWHWFEQIANSEVSEVSTGGGFDVAQRLLLRYGLMNEGDFIAEEAEAMMSQRQDIALKAINASLKDGALSKPQARTKRAVREELNRAWGLDPNVVKELDVVFGKSVSRTIDRAYVNQPLPEGSHIVRAQDFPAKLRNGDGVTKVGSLADAFYYSGTPDSSIFAWETVFYPSSPKGQRAFQKRVQRALHDGQPVMISWFVDFNALDKQSRFTLEELQSRGPGREGGHMTVLHDYEVTNVPGFGTLKAGEVETRPEALNAALSDDATIVFFRVKNSWGTYRPDRWETAAIFGYHDLYLNYLNGPVTATDPEQCPANQAPCEVTPLWRVVLPAGY